MKLWQRPQQAAGSAVAAAPFPDNLPVIGSRGGSSNASTLSNGTHTGHNSHMRAVLPNGCGQRLMLQFCNWYVGGPDGVNGSPLTGRGVFDNPGPNPITVACSIGTDDGQVFRGRWVLQVTNAGTVVRLRPDLTAFAIPGADQAWAMVTIPGGLPPGTGVWIHTFVSVTAGQWFPLWDTTFSSRGEGVTQGTSETDQTQVAPGGWTATNSSPAYWPLSVRALDAPPSSARAPILVISDSLGVNQLAGIQTKLRTDRNPFLAIGRASEAAQNVLAFDQRTEYRHKASIGGCSGALIQLLTNDCTTAGTSLATYQTRIRDVVKIARRRVSGRVVVCTLPPFSDSSDGWTTLANQTLRATGNYGNGETVKNQYNAWLRTGAQVSTYLRRPPSDLTGVDYIFDHAAVLEVDDGSGFMKYRVDGGAYTTDGLHDASALGSAATAAALDLSVFDS
jgi:hypothetical protein